MKVKAEVLAIGIINILSGKTMYEWSIYDGNNAEKTAVFLTSSRSLLFCTPDTFNIGDVVELRGNDSGRLLSSGNTIIDKAMCKQEDVLAMLKKNGYDYYPIRAFKSRAESNRKLKTSYSVKGTYV